jgi:hypothetical protein
VYDGGDCVQERNDAGSLTKQFIRGTSLGGGIGGVLYNEDASAVREYFVYNAIGSTVALANASGTVTSTNDYDAFGSVDEATGTSTNNRLFCTKERSAGGRVGLLWDALLRSGFGPVPDERPRRLSRRPQQLPVLQQ